MKLGGFLLSALGAFAIAIFPVLLGPAVIAALVAVAVKIIPKMDNRRERKRYAVQQAAWRADQHRQFLLANSWRNPGWRV